MCENECIQHHGVRGMKWGVRRYQNKDGSLTSAGKKRCAKPTEKNENKKSSKDTIKAKAIKNVKKKLTKENIARVAVKGASVAAKLGAMSIADDVFYGGMGKKILKETIKQTGRAVVTAFVMANGGYNIRWYD